jgi:hypothetical protein
VDTPLFSVPYLTARKMIIEKFFCIIVMMRWHTILLKVTHFLQKQNFLWMAQCCSAALITRQHLCHVHQRKMIALVFQKTENTNIGRLLLSFLLPADFLWPITHIGVDW